MENNNGNPPKINHPSLVNKGDKLKDFLDDEGKEKYREAVREQEIRVEKEKSFTEKIGKEETPFTEREGIKKSTDNKIKPFEQVEKEFEKENWHKNQKEIQENLDKTYDKDSSIDLKSDKTPDANKLLQNEKSLIDKADDLLKKASPYVDDIIKIGGKVAGGASIVGGVIGFFNPESVHNDDAEVERRNQEWEEKNNIEISPVEMNNALDVMGDFEQKKKPLFLLELEMKELAIESPEVDMGDPSTDSGDSSDGADGGDGGE